MLLRLTGGVLGGTDLWLYAPLIETNQNIGDAVFFTPGASVPSASMTSRPAFDTLSAAGTEVAYERTREYEARFANPFVAASKGFIDEVIMPHSTRRRIAIGLRKLRTKSLENPWKKHDNIPL